jgi:tRNA dimethylallyltransferase
VENKKRPIQKTEEDPSHAPPNAQPYSALVILGPTAMGKTALAVELASALKSEIFSLDSRQVYRGLDLGTGKDLHLYQKKQIHAHLIDCVDPQETYSLFRFQKDCYAALDDFRSRTSGSVPAVLCGGSGLYAEAVLRRYEIPEAEENVSQREAWMMRDHQELIAWLQQQDPVFAQRVDLSSKKRVVRALEIVAAGGLEQTSARFFPSWKLQSFVVCLTCPREELRARIDKRLRDRINQGLVEEVRQLRLAGLTDARLELLGMEYRAVLAHLRGEMNLSEFEMHLSREIHLLAKRQETYFRGLPKRGHPIREFPHQTSSDEILHAFREWEAAEPSEKN